MKLISLGLHDDTQWLSVGVEIQWLVLYAQICAHNGRVPATAIRETIDFGLHYRRPDMHPTRSLLYYIYTVYVEIVILCFQRQGNSPADFNAWSVELLPEKSSALFVHGFSFHRYSCL